MIFRDVELTNSELKNLLLDSDDVFSRKSAIIGTITMLNSIEKGTSILLNGKWGSGKTVFVRQIDLLNKDETISISPENVKKFREKFVTFYYNAWQCDNHENPLQSILFNLIKQNKTIKFTNEFKTAFKKILKSSINFFTGGLINVDELTESEFDKIMSEVLTVEELKVSVNKVVDVVRDNKKLLIILDELDRCNPIFAVKILETIKHYFDNDNIVFLTSTDMCVLAKTVNKFYGDKFKGEEYLNRFFDLRIDLPEIKIETYLFTKGMTAHNAVVTEFKMTPREVNRYLSLVETFVGDGRGPEKIALWYAMALKVKDPSKYESFINGESKDDFEAFLSEFSKKKTYFKKELMLEAYQNYLDNPMYSNMWETLNAISPVKSIDAEKS